MAGQIFGKVSGTIEGIVENVEAFGADVTNTPLYTPGTSIAGLGQDLTAKAGLTEAAPQPV